MAVHVSRLRDNGRQVQVSVHEEMDEFQKVIPSEPILMLNSDELQCFHCKLGNTEGP